MIRIVKTYAAYDADIAPRQRRQEFANCQYTVFHYFSSRIECGLSLYLIGFECCNKAHCK